MMDFSTKTHTHKYSKCGGRLSHVIQFHHGSVQRKLVGKRCHGGQDSIYAPIKFLYLLLKIYVIFFSLPHWLANLGPPISINKIDNLTVHKKLVNRHRWKNLTSLFYDAELVRLRTTNLLTVGKIDFTLLNVWICPLKSSLFVAALIPVCTSLGYLNLFWSPVKNSKIQGNYSDSSPKIKFPEKSDSMSINWLKMVKTQAFSQNLPSQCFFQK